METIIQTENVQFAYPAEEGKTAPLALGGVTLAIQRGSFVVVLGHNGSGKSTLAKTFNGVLLPCGGQVLVEGMDTRDEAKLLAIRQRVGMVFQNPDNQFVRHAPHLLSGGQKQRIAIAGVLAMEPACIVLDEATAMLDPVGRREVLSTVHRLNREKGITVVLITHHMDEAEEADRVVVMDDGKVAMDGTPREVFTQVDALRSMGLTVPDTVDLLDRLRRDGVDVPLDALTVEECADAVFAALNKQ